MIGSISSGTMRPQDLIPCFIEHVADDKAREGYEREVPSAACDDEYHAWWDGEEANELLNELFDVLGEQAPDYCYFGAHEGNGSDYGWWLSFDAMEGEVFRCSDANQIASPENNREHALVVNDHGNCTLYGWTGEDWEIIWEAV